MKLLYDIDSLGNMDHARIARLHRIFHGFIERYFRFEVRGLCRIPEGPGLYVGNHSGGLLTSDSFLFGSAVYRERGPEELPYGLGHEFAISLPVVHQVIVPLGAVRASHENARRIFAAGKKALVYPGGDFDDMRPFKDRNRVVFGGRQGYMRLALSHGVPIIPVVSCGSHESLLVLWDGQRLARLIGADRWMRSKVWPVSICLPWGVWVGPPLLYIPFPTWILQEVLQPIVFERTGPQAAADPEYVAACCERVESAMQACLDGLAEERASRGGTLAGLFSGKVRPALRLEDEQSKERR
ncbi:MAG: lysophospholipid acyltransferase family protein [Polyangia bacterium]|jgi:1-acyl-sn-glycerol-3-phosphate acyltransferase|nr:lysophospholipid acyltransferase family protein [Polyangia bacterium]